MKRGVDVGRVRQLNRQLVLRSLRTAGRATRASLAKQTGLTHATVSVIVGGLIDEGWVHEIGIDAIPRGRPPTVLEIEPLGHCFAGVQVGPERIRVSILDALGRVLYSQDDNTRSLLPETLCSQVARLVRQAVESAGLAWHRIDAVGVSIPGAVDPSSGVVLDLPEFEWRNEPIRERLQEALDVRVELLDEHYAMACLERLEGAALESRAAVLLSVTVEPTAVLIVEGKVHRGAAGHAGSIAHMQLPGLSQPCHCGQVGCLRTVASQEAAAKLTHELLTAGSKEIDGDRAHIVPGLALLEAASTGSPRAAQAVNEIGAHLSRATSWIANLVNPDLLILGAGLSELGDELLDPFCKQILAQCQPAIAAHLRIERSQFRGRDRARAAALVTLHETVDHLDSLFHDSVGAAVA